MVAVLDPGRIWTGAAPIQNSDREASHTWPGAGRSCCFTPTGTTDTLRPVQSSQRLSHLVALIVPTAVALMFFAPMLAGAAFLSDDYLLVAFFDQETGAVQWRQIWWDFGESWFLSPAYWRPLVSLSYGINIGLLGFTPISLHAVK